jgi:hypothetical protein
VCGVELAALNVMGENSVPGRASVCPCSSAVYLRMRCCLAAADILLLLLLLQAFSVVGWLDVLSAKVSKQQIVLDCTANVS